MSCLLCFFEHRTVLLTHELRTHSQQHCAHCPKAASPVCVFSPWGAVQPSWALDYRWCISIVLRVIKKKSQTRNVKNMSPQSLKLAYSYKGWNGGFWKIVHFNNTKWGLFWYVSTRTEHILIIFILTLFSIPSHIPRGLLCSFLLSLILLFIFKFLTKIKHTIFNWDWWILLNVPPIFLQMTWFNSSWLKMYRQRPHFIYLFICRWASRLFPQLSYCMW